MTAFLRSLSARVLIALVLGLGIGAAVQGSEITIDPGVVAGVEAVGGLWLNALQMTVVPLVFSLLVTGIAAASDAAATGRLAARSVLLFVGLVALAAALTLLLVPLVLAVWPVGAEAARALIAGAGAAPAEGLEAAAQGGGFAQWLMSLAPANPVRAAKPKKAPNSTTERAASRPVAAASDAAAMPVTSSEKTSGTTVICRAFSHRPPTASTLEMTPGSTVAPEP